MLGNAVVFRWLPAARCCEIATSAWRDRCGDVEKSAAVVRLTGVSSMSTNNRLIERIHASGKQLRRGRHRRRQRGDLRVLGSAWRVGQRARSDRALCRASARRLARRPGRSCVQRTDGPGDGDGRVRAGPRAFRRRSARAPRHRRDGQPGHNRPKRGPHRVHVAWQSADATVAFSCELEKGERTRAEEERIATCLILDAVAEACGVDAAPLDRAGVDRKDSAS